MSTYQDYANAVTDILGKEGANQANAKLESGRLWGSTIANLGQVIPAQVQAAIAQNAAKQKTAKIQSIIQQNGGDLEKSLPLIMGVDATIGQHLADEHAKVQKSIADVQKIQSDAKEAQLKWSDQLWGRVNDEDSYARAALVSHQLGEQVPDQYDPEWVKHKQDGLTQELRATAGARLGYGSSPEGIYSHATGAVTTPAAQKTLPPKADYTLGGQRFSGETNEPIATAAVPSSSAALKPGTIENYFATYAAEKNKTPDQLTTAEQEDARKRFNQADDRPRVNVSVAGAGADRLSPEAVEDTATRYRILGTSAIPTRIDAAERTRILNEAAKQTRALGQTAAESTQKQAAFKSDAASLTQMTKMASSAEAFENKALAQEDLISDLSKKVPRSASPLLNSWWLSGKKTVVGDKDTSLLFNALDTFTSEYAKIMSGSTGSAAASSDAAQRKAEGLISASMNKGTLQATLDQMKWEMNQTRKGYDTTIAHITEKMGGAPAAATPQTVQPTGRFNPSTGKVEPIR